MSEQYNYSYKNMRDKINSDKYSITDIIKLIFGLLYYLIFDRKMIELDSDIFKEEDFKININVQPNIKTIPQFYIVKIDSNNTIMITIVFNGKNYIETSFLKNITDDQFYKMPANLYT